MKRHLIAAIAISIVLVAATATALEPGDHVFLARGNVLVTEAEGSIYVAVDEHRPDREADGVTDWLFILQRANSAPPPQDLPARLTGALVFFDQTNLLLRASSSQSTYLLTIADGRRVRGLVSRPSRTRASGDEPAETGAADPMVTAHGIGLAYRRGGSEFVWRALGITEAPEARPITAADELPCGPDGEGGSSSSVYCYSGGCGAASCTVSCDILSIGCGITCNSGYYACCNCEFTSECGCHPNDDCGC